MELEVDGPLASDLSASDRARVLDDLERQYCDEGSDVAVSSAEAAVLSADLEESSDGEERAPFAEKNRQPALPEDDQSFRSDREWSKLEEEMLALGNKPKPRTQSKAEIGPSVPIPRKPSIAKVDKMGRHANHGNVDVAPSAANVELGVVGVHVGDHEKRVIGEEEEEDAIKANKDGPKKVPINSKVAAAAREQRIKERAVAKKRSPCFPVITYPSQACCWMSRVLPWTIP